jgi:metal-sulfur cluster biosynthetic enzyme
MPADPSPVTEAAVRQAIDTVVDPCSRLHGTDLSLIDLGMVEAVTVSGGTVHVALLLDDPLCTYTYVIQHELRTAIERLGGIDEVDITVVPNASWTDERVLPAARSRLIGDRLKSRLPLMPANLAAAGAPAVDVRPAG